MVESFTVALLGDPTLGRALAKASTSSDIELYHKKHGNRIYTFIAPKSYPEKPQLLFQCLSIADAVVFAPTEVNAQAGEQIIAINLAGKPGIMAAPEEIRSALAPFTKNTSLAGFEALESSPDAILAGLEKIPKKPLEGAPKAVVDHYFEVKGIGTVILGFVERNEIRAHDKMKLLPAEKFVEIRSIQMQDEDHKKAVQGDRFGIALKGAETSDLERGSVLVHNQTQKALKELNAKFQRSPFYKADFMEGKKVHACIGMQFVLGTLKKAEGEKVTVSFEKGVAAEPGEAFYLMDLNSKGLRIIGKGISE